MVSLAVEMRHLRRIYQSAMRIVPDGRGPHGAPNEVPESASDVNMLAPAPFHPQIDLQSRHRDLNQIVLVDHCDDGSFVAARVLGYHVAFTAAH
jgi:hypothetical protein